METRKVTLKFWRREQDIIHGQPTTGFWNTHCVVIGEREIELPVVRYGDLPTRKLWWFEKPRPEGKPHGDGWPILHDGHEPFTLSYPGDPEEAPYWVRSRARCVAYGPGNSVEHWRNRLANICDDLAPYGVRLVRLQPWPDLPAYMGWADEAGNPVMLRAVKESIRTFERCKTRFVPFG